MRSPPIISPVELVHGEMMAQPAERMPTEHDSTVSIHVVQGLVDAVVSTGVERNAFLAAAGFNCALLCNDEARIGRLQMFRLCELALDLTGDAALGLHWGESSSESTFTPLSHLIAHSANLGTGFQTLFEYQRLMSDETTYELLEEGEQVTLRLSSPVEASVRLRTFVVEMEAVGIYRLMRMFGPEVRPQRISFAYAAPVYRGEYARIFQGIERFEQPYSCITFSRTLLGSVPPHKDDDVRSALQAIASRRVLRLTKRMPYALRVREQLVKLGRGVRWDMSEVAHALGLSVRSLRRRLEAEAVTFNAIANEAAAIIAKHLLEGRNRSIQEVAFDMGFADASGFHRAFKRWTGVTPRAYLEGRYLRTPVSTLNTDSFG
jgi:AraC-like DNA-binding protein